MSAWIFLAAAMLVVYVYAGYPVLIALLARARARARSGSAPRPSARPMVAVVIVAFDESARIGAKVASCLAQSYPRDRMRIVVVSDGCTDDTLAQARAAGGARVATLGFPTRRGKAACLNDVVPELPDEIVVLTDVRQPLSPDAVERLVSALDDPAVGAASGELIFVDGNASDFGAGVDAYWRYEKFIRRAESAAHACIGVTGALYAIRRPLFERIPPDTVLDDVLIPMQVVRAGHRVLFVDDAIAYDRPSASPAQERARKTRTLAGNFQLLVRQPWLMSPVSNPAFVQFVSHKALRLAVPPALVALLASNAVLAADGATAWRVVFALQLTGYALPLLGRLSPAVARLRIVRMATAFLVLNWFVVLGLASFLRSRDTHLWQVTRSTVSSSASSSGDRAP